MNIQELASLMNISKEELVEQLKNSDVIELKLIEKKNDMVKENFKIDVLK